jgi:hypothetical protein
MPAVKSNSELRQLPLRALLAYAVRCARRVQMHFALPHGPVAEAAAMEAIDRALRIVEDMASGIDASEDEVSVAESNLFAVVIAVSQTEPVDEQAAYAANAAHAAINAAKFVLEAQRGMCRPDQVVEAVAIGRDAACAADDRVAGRAAADLALLERRGLGSFPDAGQPIDASERATLGPLFEDGSATGLATIHDRVMRPPPPAPAALAAHPRPEGAAKPPDTKSALPRNPAGEIPRGTKAPHSRRRLQRAKARLKAKRARLAREAETCHSERRQLALERDKLARFAEEARREAAALREAQAQLQAESQRIAAEREEFSQQCEQLCIARDELEEAQRQLDEERSKLESDRARFMAELARLGTFLSGLIVPGGGG